MGKTYYCDYCDRFFKDEVEARKKHLSSMQHVANRESHYSIYKDPETRLKEVYEKTPCKRFMSIGECSFGYGCRFSHYTRSMIWELEQCVAMKKSKLSEVQPKDGWPNSEEIINEYFKHAIISNGSKDLNPMWATSSEAGYRLPASLQPITLETMKDSDFNKWG